MVWSWKASQKQPDEYLIFFVHFVRLGMFSLVTCDIKILGIEYRQIKINTSLYLQIHQQYRSIGAEKYN